MARLGKEQVLLLLTAAVGAGLVLTAGGGGAAPGRPRRGTPKAFEAAPLAKPLIPMESRSLPGRDLFQRPLESEPLPSLDLALPPRLDLPIVGPVPLPGPGPAGFPALRISGTPADPPVALPEEAAAPPGEEAPGEPAPEPGPQPALAPDPALLRQRYDWVELRSGATYWGFIVNERRFDLKLPLEQPIRIKAVDLRRGTSSGTLDFKAELVVGFGFAETVPNWIERERRRLRRGQAFARERREFLNQLLEKAEEHPEALAEAGNQVAILVADAPDTPESYLMQAQFFARSGDLESECTLYQRLLGEPRFGEMAFVHLGLGRVLERLTLHREAEREFRRAARLEPGSFEALSGLGTFLLNQGRPDEALAILQKAVILAPADPRARFESRLQVWTALLALGRIEEAAEEARRAREAGFETPLLDLLDGVGFLLVPAKRAEALEPLARAAEAQPDRAQPGLALGAALALTGKPLEALAILAAAAERDPMVRPRVLAARAFVLRQAGHPAEALAAAEAGLAMAPSDPYLLYLTGRLRRENGDRENARNALGELLRRHGEVPEAMVELALVELGDGELLKARRLAARALERAPGPVPAIWQELLGDVLLLLRLTDEAERIFAAAMQRDRSPHARIGLAQVAYYRGETATCLDILEKVYQDGALPATDRFSRFAQELHDLVADHAQKEQVGDDFQRPELGRRWKAPKLRRAQQRLADGVLLLEGTLEDRPLAAIREGEDAALFVSLEVECRILPGHQAERAGLRLGCLRQARGVREELDPEILLFWDGDRREGVVQVLSARGKEEDRRPVAVPAGVWKPGEAVRLRVEFGGLPGVETKAQTLRLLVGEQQVKALELPELGRGAGKLQIELFATGKAGTQAQVAFDNFRLVRRRAKEAGR